MGLEVVFAYLERLAVPLVLTAAVFALIRPDRDTRVVLYLVVFVLVRDAMTPVGLWSFGTEGFFWLRFHGTPLVLIILGISSATMVAALYLFDTENRKRLPLFLKSPVAGIVAGTVGAVVVVAPIAAFYLSVPIESRGGPVPSSLLPAVAAIAFLGNFLEEALFRGLVLDVVSAGRSRLHGGVLSGVLFAFCHIFLAATVTDVGLPLLAFTLWEGVIAGMVAGRYGVVPATATHGGAIFLLSSGLL